MVAEHEANLTAQGRRRSLLLPTIFAVIGVAILAGLGTWQLQRKAWKEGLIAKIEARTHAEPVDLATALSRVRAGEDMEYTRIRAHGRYEHEKERHLYAPEQTGPGWHVYTPLETPSGVLFVNRGFVPDAAKDPAIRVRNDTGAENEVTGLLRMPERPGLFAPKPDPSRNEWYWRDLHGMAASVLRDRADRVLPFFLDAEAARTPASPGEPRGGVTRLEIPNRHLEYALTWYGLALTLIGVYLTMVISRGSGAH